MAEADEFELAAEPAPAPTRATRHRRDRPARWIALAALAVAAGALAAPATAPRSAGQHTPWGGIGGLTVITTLDQDADTRTVAEDYVAGVTGTNSDGEILSTVVWVVHAEAGAGSTDLTAAAAHAAQEAMFDGLSFITRAFTELEAAAPRSDWLCEPVREERTLCTALADPAITIELDGHWLGG